MILSKGSLVLVIAALLVLMTGVIFMAGQKLSSSSTKNIRSGITTTNTTTQNVK